MTAKVTKVDRIAAIIDEIAQRILLELESAKSSDLSDVHYAKKILHLADIHYARMVLQQIGTKHASGSESEIEKSHNQGSLVFHLVAEALFYRKILHHGGDRCGRYVPFHLFPWHNKRFYGNCLWSFCIRAFLGYNKTV